jgi:hypothetical protein
MSRWSITTTPGNRVRRNRAQILPDSFSVVDALAFAGVYAPEHSVLVGGGLQFFARLCSRTRSCGFVKIN